jgi:RNA polymerase sigma-70 factor (ECF subfamily)
MVGEEFSGLLDRAVHRDERAFGELWRTYHPSLLRYLRTMHADAAEDLASETWLGVARSIRNFDGDEFAFRAWLFTIARRRVLDFRRAMQRRPPSDSREIPDRGAPDAVDSADQWVATQAALKLIAQLPPDQAEVVALRSIAGLDVERVAAIVGKRPGTVRVLAHRGLRRLRDVIESEL